MVKRKPIVKFDSDILGKPGLVLKVMVKTNKRSAIKHCLKIVTY